MDGPTPDKMTWCPKGIGCVILKFHFQRSKFQNSVFLFILKKPNEAKLQTFAEHAKLCKLVRFFPHWKVFLCVRCPAPTRLGAHVIVDPQQGIRARHLRDVVFAEALAVVATAEQPAVLKDKAHCAIRANNEGGLIYSSSKFQEKRTHKIIYIFFSFVIENSQVTKT